MYFLRTLDDAIIQGIDEVVTFDTHNRKGNDVVTVTLSHNKVEYSAGKLMTKMIPGEERAVFESTNIYVVQTEHSSRFHFQDPNNTVRFLVFEDDGTLIPTRFLDLTEDDEILLYDDASKDFYISQVSSLEIIDMTPAGIPDESGITALNSQLSNYVIYSDSIGYIIEEFIII